MNREELSQLDKCIYKKPTVNIYLMVKCWRHFPPKFETKQGCSLLPILINLVLEANTVRQ